MKKILLLSFVFLLFLVGNTQAQFGTKPFGQSPFATNGPFGKGPFGSGGGAPNGALQDDSGHYLNDDAGHYIIAG